GACDLGADGASCVAASDASCLASTACKVAGLCAAQGGACKATRDEDCRAARICAAMGQCRAVEGWCAAGNATDCRASAYCRRQTRCGALHGTCCRDIECDDIPTIVSLDGHRVRTDADCAGYECVLVGRCRAEGGACVAGGDADCLLSRECHSEGACFAE